MTDRNNRTDFNDSGVVQLFRDVAGYIDRFWKNDAPAVVFGWRERAKQINDGVGGANRIVMVPGELEGGDGTLEAPDGPGDQEGGTFPGATSLQGIPLVQAIPETIVTPKPRALFQANKPITFSLWAGNEGTPDAKVDELAAEEVIEQMREWLYRAVKASSVGASNGVWRKHNYNRKPAEIRFGTEYLAVLELVLPFYDRDNVVVIPSDAAVTRANS